MCFQGKEATEEEDEVAVGMEKGFMDEFFEQVCHAPSCLRLALVQSPVVPSLGRFGDNYAPNSPNSIDWSLHSLSLPVCHLLVADSVFSQSNSYFFLKENYSSFSRRVLFCSFGPLSASRAAMIHQYNQLR